MIVPGKASGRKIDLFQLKNAVNFIEHATFVRRFFFCFFQNCFYLLCVHFGRLFDE